MAPDVDGEEKTSGLLAKLEGTAAATADLSQLASDPAVYSWVEIGPMKVLGAGKGSERSMYGSSRRKSPKSSLLKRRE